MSAKIGRPTKYDAEKHIAAVLSPECLSDGATWTAIARACEVSVSTVRDWTEQHEGFSAAVKTAKDMTDDEVEVAFKHNAAGGAVKSIALDGTVTLYPPDTTAGIFWLCNRRPDRWRHVQRVEHTGAGGGPLAVSVIDPRRLPDDVLDALEAATGDSGEPT